MESKFVKFPKVRYFQHVCTEQQKRNSRICVTYGAKIKLHGTNAGVRITADGQVTAQKRRGDISIEEDNFEFAAWIDANIEAWKQVDNAGDIVVYGEWAGQGVQRKAADAVEQIPERQFFVFGVLYNGFYIAEPSMIEDLVPKIPRLHVLPWILAPSSEMSLNFMEESTVAKVLARINTAVDEIEAVDPYIRDMFGITGPGEGVVVAPVSVDGSSVFWKQAGNLMFKTKVPQHTGKKKSKAATRKLSVPKDMEAFSKEFVTEQRCQQGVGEACGGKYKMKLLRRFVDWMKDDVKSESNTELDAMKAEWSDAEKHVTRQAVLWYTSHIKK